MYTLCRILLTFLAQTALKVSQKTSVIVCTSQRLDLRLRIVCQEIELCL